MAGPAYSAMNTPSLESVKARLTAVVPVLLVYPDPIPRRGTRVCVPSAELASSVKKVIVYFAVSP